MDKQDGQDVQNDFPISCLSCTSMLRFFFAKDGDEIVDGKVGQMSPGESFPHEGVCSC